jgi:hypothetical protein
MRIGVDFMESVSKTLRQDGSEKLAAPVHRHAPFAGSVGLGIGMAFEDLEGDVGLLYISRD